MIFLHIVPNSHCFPSDSPRENAGVRIPASVKEAGAVEGQGTAGVWIVVDGMKMSHESAHSLFCRL